MWGIKYHSGGCCPTAQTEAKAAVPRSPDWQADFRSCHNIQAKPSNSTRVGLQPRPGRALLPQQRVGDLQAAVGAAEAVALPGACQAARLQEALPDDTQRKSPRDRVEDHGSQTLGDWLASADVEPDQGRNAVEAIVFELEELPGVALVRRGRSRESKFERR